MKDVLGQLSEALSAGRGVVYCRLVETRGSTPQKAGATMLVFPDGSQAGTLGGGCVEAEVKRRALEILERGQPEVVGFQLDSDYGWDDGLICGGRMQVLVEPLAASLNGNGNTTVREGGAGQEGSGPDGSAQGQEGGIEIRDEILDEILDGGGRNGAEGWDRGDRNGSDYYRRLAELAVSGEGCSEVVVFDAEKSGLAAPSCYLFDAGERLVAECRGQLNGGEPPALVRELLRPLAGRPQPAASRGAAFLPSLPRCRLLIVGGGHIGQAVGNMATDLDFDVWVVDDRADFVRPERFPRAQRRMAGEITSLLADIEITPNTYCLIVTRGHNHDEEALFHLADRGARYVGLIGSRRKIKLIFQDLLDEGVSREALAKVYAPLGIDIGSQTVSEIAVSILAELVSHRNRGGVVPGRPDGVVDF